MLNLFYTWGMEIEPRDIMDILEHVPLFSHLGELDISRWAGLFQVEHHKNGQVIFDFDDPAQAMYILYEGNVRLRLYDDPETDFFAKLGKGDCLVKKLYYLMTLVITAPRLWVRRPF